MPLKIYNTLTRKKETFEPLTPGKIKMYVCGITVYDECHLGHARAAIVFDVVYRYLKHLGYDVTYIRNFTDVDDKIIRKSQETKTPWQDITERYIKSYQEQTAKLNCLSPTSEPKATEHIPEMLKIIQQLIDKGLAYPSNGDVFYRVRKFPNYGVLSQKKIDELESGARIEVDEKKEDPLDFALWKSAKPGEPEWDSPWGKGRPGWHIECSAMSMKYLGERFDIHGGGRDLMFPHHVNEIAQSEGATGKSPFAKYWIHNGFVNINAEKMSKSLGNFRSIPAILEQWDPEVVRYFLLSAHYASPLDFTDDAIANAREGLSRVYETLLRLQNSPDTEVNWEIEFEKILSAGMDDDFNVSSVIGDLFVRLRELNALINTHGGLSKKSKEDILKGFRETIGGVIGIFNSDPAAFFNKLKMKGLETAALNEAEIQAFIVERKQARASRDFKRSDEIRQELSAKGILLKDNPDGTTSWEIKT